MKNPGNLAASPPPASVNTKLQGSADGYLIVVIFISRECIVLNSLKKCSSNETSWLGWDILSRLPSRIEFLNFCSHLSENILVLNNEHFKIPITFWKIPAWSDPFGPWKRKHCNGMVMFGKNTTPGLTPSSIRSSRPGHVPEIQIRHKGQSFPPFLFLYPNPDCNVSGDFSVSPHRN